MGRRDIDRATPGVGYPTTLQPREERAQVRRHSVDDAGVKLGAPSQPCAAGDPAAAPAEGDPPIGRRSHVVNHRSTVGNAFAADPADLLEQLRDWFGQHDVAGGHREAPAHRRTGGAGRGPEGENTRGRSDSGPRRLAQAAPASGAQPTKRRALKNTEAGAVAEPLTQAERQSCRLHSRRTAVKHAGTKAGRSAALPHLLSAQLLHRAGLAELPAGGDRLVPDPVLGRRCRDLQVSALLVPGVDSLFRTEPADLVHGALSRPPDASGCRPPEALAQGVHAEPHGVGKTATPTAGPMPAAVRLQQDHARCRRQLGNPPGRPHARVAAAGYQHVAVQLSLGGRQRRTVASLLEPVATGRVLHRNVETPVGRPPCTRYSRKSRKRALSLLGRSQDLFGRALPAPKRPLHQPVPLASGVLAGEEEGADRLHQVVVAKWR